MELGIYLFKSVAILSLFYMVYFVFLRKDTLFTAKRHFFLGGIVAALFLPFLEFTQTIYREAPILQQIPEMGFTATATEMSVTQEPEMVLSFWQIALIGYCIGVVIMVTKLVVQLFSLLKLLRTYPSEKHQKYTFIKVAEAITPFSFFRYIVFNPAFHSEEELKMILKHEQVHVSQWHSVDIIIGHLTRAVQWINPFSWWYKKSLEENLEFIADNETVAQVPSKKDYQLALVKTSSPLHAPVLSTQFYQSFIKKRIIMLNKSTSKRRNLWKLSFVIPVLAVFLWSFNVKEVVEYKEIESTQPDKAVSYMITSETTDAELDAIENELEKQAKDSNIRFEDRKRNELNQLYKFSLKTKFNNQFRYYTNAVLGDDTGKGIGELNVKFDRGAFKFSNPSMTRVIRITANGVVIEQPSKTVSGEVIKPADLHQPPKALTTNTSKPEKAATFESEPIEKTAEFRYTITKNTSNAQLEEIKTELKKEYNIDLKYKAERNSSNEIIAINISYTDNKGGSGNYSINNDDEPIDDFIFFLNEDGERGFWSEEQEVRRAERMEERMEEREKRMEERAERMREREMEMVELKERAEKRQVIMKEAMEERKLEMKARQKEMIEQELELARGSNERAKRNYQKAKEMEEKLARYRDREVVIIDEDGKWNKMKTPSGVYVYSSSDNNQGVFVISKDTSDKELSNLKRKMAAEGISFDYSKVKRNSLGEITRIKITTKNGKGSKSVISAQADDGEPINEIIIQN